MNNLNENGLTPLAVELQKQEIDNKKIKHILLNGGIIAGVKDVAKTLYLSLLNGLDLDNFCYIMQRVIKSYAYIADCFYSTIETGEYDYIRKFIDIFYKYYDCIKAANTLSGDKILSAALEYCDYETIKMLITFIKNHSSFDNFQIDDHMNIYREAIYNSFEAFKLVADLFADNEKQKIENVVNNALSDYFIKDLTLLHIACASGDLKIISYLVDKGANIYAKDNEENTPFVYALESDNLTADIIVYFALLGVKINDYSINNQKAIEYLITEVRSETINDKLFKYYKQEYEWAINEIERRKTAAKIHLNELDNILKDLYKRTNNGE